MLRGLAIVLIGLFGLAGLRADDAFPVSKRDGFPNDDWRDNIGVPGGIPQVTNQYTNITAAMGLSGAQFNTVIGNCPSNQFILMSAGTYNFGGAKITLNKSGAVIRGETNANGASLVQINDCYWTFGKGATPFFTDPSELSSINISSGLTEGSVSITLASAPNSGFAVGTIMGIDQTDDGTLVKSWSQGWATRASRAYVHVALVTNISGSTIGFTPPLVGKYWSSGQDPEAYGFAALSSYGPTLFRSGLEDVKINQDGGDTYAIRFHLAHGCWMKNVSLTGWGTGGGAAGVRWAWATQCSIRDGVFHDQVAVSSSSYAVYPTVVSYCEVENCLFTNLALAMPTISAVACSFSYNVGLGPYPYNPTTWHAEYIFPHGGHTSMCLYEGNWLEAPMWFDAIFSGNNSYNAVIRSRIQGFYSGKSGGLVCIRLEPDMDHITMLGNILGWDGGAHTGYEAVNGYGVIYGITNGLTGTIRTNNYNTVTDGVHANEAIGSNTMQDSYRYASKPSWAGDRQWPFYPVSSTMTNVLQYTNSPAGYRAQYGTWPPAAAQGGGGPVGGPARKQALRGIRLRR